jgi:hypothetical protein
MFAHTCDLELDSFSNFSKHQSLEKISEAACFPRPALDWLAGSGTDL